MGLDMRKERSGLKGARFTTDEWEMQAKFPKSGWLKVNIGRFRVHELE